jgi:hypothetical protein
VHEVPSGNGWGIGGKAVTAEKYQSHPKANRMRIRDGGLAIERGAGPLLFPKHLSPLRRHERPGILDPTGESQSFRQHISLPNSSKIIISVLPISHFMGLVALAGLFAVSGIGWPVLAVTEGPRVGAFAIMPVAGGLLLGGVAVTSTKAVNLGKELAAPA